MGARIAAKDLKQGQELPPWSYNVVREDLVRYANASGDANPIHQNEEFAKSVGLPDIIAHGMHTMARMGQYVTDWTGATVTVGGKVADTLDGDRVRIDLVATTQDGAAVAKGEAIVALG
jgi:acyl dehydratase